MRSARPHRSPSKEIKPPPYWRQTGLSLHPPVARIRSNKRRKAALNSWLVLLFGLAANVVVALAIAAMIYVWIARQLPSADELRSRSFQFATTQILDREGNLLWEIIDPSGGRRTDVSLNQISPDLIKATLATEDRYFFLNVGVDPVAIARAVYYNLSEGEVVSGGSTITQQLARNVFLSPEERIQKSWGRKIKEAVLAVEINRRYSKRQILEIYFNQIYYGNLSYGIEAAARTYLGKSAGELTLAEAALLAGLPQSPALYDPYTNPDAAKTRQLQVLALMVEAGYITPVQAEAAKATPLELRDTNFNLKAPHFVYLVQQELERNIPAAYLYQAGLRVYTTLDPHLQSIAEEEVNAQVADLADRHVGNGALVALEVSTGQILALVGSTDFHNEQIDGQVSVVTALRQPGSTIKPLTYLAAFEKLNWTPSTLLMDTPVEYPDFAGNAYRPGKRRPSIPRAGLLREGAINSYNIPAVKTLDKVGLEALKEMAARLGITTLTRTDYGLSLTLGSGEVSLLQMTGVYQAIANKGWLIPPTTILKITDAVGREVEPIRSQPRQALRPEHAYLITHILADNEARAPAFGLDSPLHLSRPAAAKTGTTTDFRDNWTIGYTPDLVAGVWVGNSDNTPMLDVGGVSGAAPIWHNFMERAHENWPVHDFKRPAGIIELEVCADSGTLPSEVCPRRRTEIFFQDQPPLGPEQDLHQWVELDRASGLLVNQFCRGNIEKRYYQVFPPDGRAWAIEHGIAQPPTKACPSENIVARLTNPVDNAAVRGTVEIKGSAVAPRFAYFQLELGAGTNPQDFQVIQGQTKPWIRKDLLARFDTTQLANGPYTLRLVVYDDLGGFSEARVRMLVDNPPASIIIRTPVTTPPFTPTLTLTATRVITINGTAVITYAPALTQPITIGTPIPGQTAGQVLTLPVSIAPEPIPTTPITP
ncbi:MAG: PBP1A family penicillin-binding protein [Anaerolineae bacterium]